MALVAVDARQRASKGKFEAAVFRHGREVIHVKGTFNVTFTVEPAQLSVPATQDLGPVGGPLDESAVDIEGGTPPYSVALDPASGPLPDGVTMDGNGNLSGTPTKAGSFPVVLDVTDANG